MEFNLGINSQTKWCDITKFTRDRLPISASLDLFRERDFSRTAPNFPALGIADPQKIPLTVTEVIAMSQGEHAIGCRNRVGEEEAIRGEKSVPYPKAWPEGWRVRSSSN